MLAVNDLQHLDALGIQPDPGGGGGVPRNAVVPPSYDAAVDSGSAGAGSVPSLYGPGGAGDLPLAGSGGVGGIPLGRYLPTVILLLDGQQLAIPGQSIVVTSPSGFVVATGISDAQGLCVIALPWNA